MRRKCERKLERVWPEWGEAHPVHNVILRGSGWFNAWYSQACTPWAVIEKRAGIERARLAEFDRGARPTEAELAVLAKLWRCPAEQIVASID